MTSAVRESLRTLKSNPSEGFTESVEVNPGSSQPPTSCPASSRSVSVSCRVLTVNDPVSTEFTTQHVNRSARRPNSLKLRHAARTTTSDSTISSTDDVKLPRRFQRQISSVDQLEQRQLLLVPCESLTWTERERDLGLAITWIQQQIWLLKQEDRVIMRQLLELRANIRNRPGSTVRKRHSFTVDSPDVATRSSMYPQQLLSVQTAGDSPVSRDDILERFRDRASMEEPPTHTAAAAGNDDADVQSQYMASSSRVSAAVSTGQLVQRTTASDAAFRFTSDELFV